MDIDILEKEWKDAGELMIQVAEIDKPIELHLHDTEFDHVYDTIEHQLTDGRLVIDVEDVTSCWIHTHSTEDYGLE